MGPIGSSSFGARQATSIAFSRLRSRQTCCRDPITGKIDPWAADLVERVASYTEITVSGTGLRIIGEGNRSKLHRKLPVTNGVSVEVYRKAERCIVITGNPLPKSNGAGIVSIDEHLDATVAELEAKKASVKQNTPREESPGGGGDKLERIIRCGENGEFKGDRSRAVWWVVCEMLRQNCVDTAIVSTLLDRANKISDHVNTQAKPREYAERQVAEARAKITPTAQAPQLQIQSTTEFITNFTPPEYLVYGLLQRRFIYSMTGPTGEGKTSVALSLALHVDRGWPFGGREIDKRPSSFPCRRKS